MDTKKTFGKPYTELSLLDFQLLFPDEKSCWDYLVKIRWPQGLLCPKCGCDEMGFIKTRRHFLFQCRKKCGKQVSVTAGSVFHKSRVPLRKWFWAIFLMATSKKGVSMLYLQRQLGLKSYRSAWLMGQKIRTAMARRDELYILKGTVQADEIFIGGKQSKENRDKMGKNKTPFLMAVEEGSVGNPRFVTLKELEDITQEYVLPALQKSVFPGSKIKTDGAVTYQALRKRGYTLEQSSYNQNPREATEHLKWVNMLTSNLKRFLISTYHGVHPKYRKQYLAEFAYRFNRRYWPHQAFDRLLYACANTSTITLNELRA